MPQTGQSIGIVAELETEQAQLLQQLEAAILARDEKGARAYQSAAESRKKEIEAINVGLVMGPYTPVPAFGNVIGLDDGIKQSGFAFA